MREITVTSSTDQIRAVTDFVNEQLSGLKCPEEIRIEIDVAVDEIFGNISHYAYDPETGPVTIRFCSGEFPHSAVITFIDHGLPFDPLKTDDPDLSEPLRRRAIGGLGLYIVKNTMDEVTYRYEEGQNMLTIRKNI